MRREGVGELDRGELARHRQQGLEQHVLELRVDAVILLDLVRGLAEDEHHDLDHLEVGEAAAVHAQSAQQRLVISLVVWVRVPTLLRPLHTGPQVSQQSVDRLEDTRADIDIHPPGREDGGEGRGQAETGQVLN